MRDLLFEIGTEEIPAGFIEPALAQLKNLFTEKMAQLKVEHGQVRTIGSPRRMALLVDGLAEQQEDLREELIGPSKKAGVGDDGSFSKAAEGFARSKGADVSELKLVDTAKGEYLMLIRETKGRPVAELLPQVLSELVTSLSFAKSMRWGSNRQSFARPIQWLVALFGKEVIGAGFEQLKAGNTSFGHRFMAPEAFVVESPARYEDQLLERHVIVDGRKRREAVLAEIHCAADEAEAFDDAMVSVDENLLDTVTNLVEFPFAICGTFDEKFLQVPAEVLITSMREHQKYFPVVSPDGALLPGFIAVNNTEVNDEDVTRRGHQRVLRARLEDALFFFNSDRQKSLESRVEALRGIIFQARLGTMLEKRERLVKLSRTLAEVINPTLATDACRAAELCKADLLTDMVGEFPTLQGTMGASYASGDGESRVVAEAIMEHYLPKRAGSELPDGDVGAILGLADRFDTLTGCFGIQQIPTGTTDPFGLRRIALAIIHIIAGKGYKLSLAEMVKKSLALYGDKVDGNGETVQAVLAFIRGRFVNDCISKGTEAGVVESVVSVGFDDINDCLKRIEAVNAIKRDDSFRVLAASYKRVRNIIKDNSATDIDVALFEHAEEKSLYEVYLQIDQEMRELVDVADYGKALTLMLRMKEPVDGFFDKVMVMADDQLVRTNRLNLLTALGELILKVADISKVQES